MKFRFAVLLVLSFSVGHLPPVARADHPGSNLDEVMQQKEKYFQPIDQPAPDFELTDAKGNSVNLSNFAENILVLNFIFASCLGDCPLHSEKIAQVQALINASPMKDLVRFVSVTTDPQNDTPDVLGSYGELHGLDSANWMFLTTQEDQAEDYTRKLAREYGLDFSPTDDGQQMHGVVTHVIDRAGRLAGRFHGLRFESINMVLYINGLTNDHGVRKHSQPPGIWERIRSWF
jgi:protein SCO1